MVPCFDFRGVPPGDRCTLVHFRRELLPIFNASTMEVGVADARADEQRRAGMGPEGDSTCLDFSSESRFKEDWGDGRAWTFFCCGFDDTPNACWFGGKLNPKGGGVGGGGGGGGGAVATAGLI